MATLDEVTAFLNDFFAKYRTFEILFRDARHKNTTALFDLDMTRLQRLAIVEGLVPLDYSEGPLDDEIYGIAALWVFGKTVKKREIYIKISMGHAGSQVICISFHPSEHPMNYPLKSKV